MQSRQGLLAFDALEFLGVGVFVVESVVGPSGIEDEDHISGHIGIQQVEVGEFQGRSLDGGKALALTVTTPRGGHFEGTHETHDKLTKR